MDTQLGPAPLEAASAYLHIKYADKRSRRLVTHRTDCLVAMLDGTAMLVVKVCTCGGHCHAASKGVGGGGQVEGSSHAVSVHRHALSGAGAAAAGRPAAGLGPHRRLKSISTWFLCRPACRCWSAGCWRLGAGLPCPCHGR